MEDQSQASGGRPREAVGNPLESGLSRHTTMTINWAPLASGLFVAALLVWMFWEFFDRQVRFAINRPADWGHTLIIPIVAGYFVYLNRRRLLAQPFRTCWLGLVPLVLGIAWYVLCNVGMPTLRNHNLMGLGACLAIFGAVLLFFGVRATIVLLFPMAFLFVFGQTVSDRFMSIVTYQLQDITAIGSHILLDLVLDVDRKGNTLFIVQNGQSIPLNIAEACSGMRMLMAFFAMGVFLAYTGLDHLWQRVLLVAMAVPTAIVVNVLRVVTLGLLSLLDVEFAAGDFHSAVGLIWLVPALLMFYGIRIVIRRLILETPADASAVSGAPSATEGPPRV